MGSIVKCWWTLIEEVLCREEVVALVFLSLGMLFAGRDRFKLRKTYASSLLRNSLHFVDGGVMEAFGNRSGLRHRFSFFALHGQLILGIGSIRLGKEGVVHLRGTLPPRSLRYLFPRGERTFIGFVVRAFPLNLPLFQ